MAVRVLSFYARLPEEIKRPFEGEAFNSQTRKELGKLLENPETAESLLADMDTVLVSLPPDFVNYERRVQILAELHGYVEGTYTIFPERKKETWRFSLPEVLWCGVMLVLCIASIASDTYNPFIYFQF